MRRFGDRPDGEKIRNLDSMHYIMPLVFPNRCDNEAFMTLNIELDKIEKFIEEQNKGKSEEEKYTLFGILIAALIKVVHKRPQLNRFIANKNIYQRNHVSAAFIVKKSLSDYSEETMARIVGEKEDTLESIKDQVNYQIKKCRTESDETTDAMNFIQKLPLKGLIGLLARWADKRGLMPQSVIATDPYQCTVVLTNLGSIGLNVGYHHLMNWGTNSIFVVVGQKKYVPIYDRNGNVKMKKVLPLSFTVDERISDGYYFGKSLRLLKRLCENPELLMDKFVDEDD
ncbi:MAG: 2-oxo acid dehydrogenase subunit E2 [Lachnospiraceae bacterium]|nr:2-oxo acid dehydrogenase subunit E2 [Lachnospiraceae bacterium]